MMTRQKIMGVIFAIVFVVGLLILTYLLYQRYDFHRPSVSNEAMQVQENPSRCHSSVVTVLSIDGGGVKGIIPAVFLEKFEQGTQEPISTLFHFMSGVSTGTILIALLTAPTDAGLPKYKADELVRIYKTNAAQVFSAGFFHRIITLGGLIGPKFESSGMHQITTKYLGNTAMSQLLSHVVLFGYDLKNKGLIAFSNSDTREVNMPYYKVRDVVDGTTAIMSYFPSKNLYDIHKQIRHTVADASLVLNNPTIMSFLFAQQQCPHAQHYIVVSLGTGKIPTVDIHAKTWGLIRWLPDMLVTTIEGETVTANVTMEKLASIMNESLTPNDLPRVLFVRLNPNVSWENSDPVSASSAQLQTLEKIAETYYQQNKSLFDCLFPILKNHSFDQTTQQCIDLMKKNPDVVAPLYFDLENNGTSNAPTL